MTTGELTLGLWVRILTDTCFFFFFLINKLKDHIYTGKKNKEKDDYR